MKIEKDAKIMIAIGCGVLVVFGGFLAYALSIPSTPYKKPTVLAPIVPAGPPPPKIKTAAELLTEANQNRALLGAGSLQAATKDPVSFEVRSVEAHPDGTICYVYRAKNSFNAMLQGRAVFPAQAGGLLTQESNGNAFIRAWNKGCLKGDSDDITAYASEFVKFNARR